MRLPALCQFCQLSQQSIALYCRSIPGKVLNGRLKAFYHLGGKAFFVGHVLRCGACPVVFCILCQHPGGQQNITGMLQGTQQVGQQAKIFGF